MTILSLLNHVLNIY